jgi:hypothetical protein
MSSVDRVPVRAPLYVRALKLRRLRIGGLVSFLLFECMIALGVLLALAELVSWWAVAVLPGAVALMVKVNDLAMGGGRPRRPARPVRPARRGGTREQPSAPEAARVEPARTAAGRSGAAPAQASAGGRTGSADLAGETAAPPDSDEPRRPVGTIRISVPARDGGTGRTATLTAGTITAQAGGRHARETDDASPRERRGDARWLREDTGNRWESGQNQGRFA